MSAITDEELARYLDVPVPWVAKMTPEDRAAYQRLHDTELAIKLWLAGLAEKPTGVIVCDARRPRGH